MMKFILLIFLCALVTAENGSEAKSTSLKSKQSKNLHTKTSGIILPSKTDNAGKGKTKSEKKTSTKAPTSKKIQSRRTKKPTKFREPPMPKTEQDLGKIITLGKMSSCPFNVTRNFVANRIPSTFYELECLHCKECGTTENPGKCTQLETMMTVKFLSDISTEKMSTSTLYIKSGCTCFAKHSTLLPASYRQSWFDGSPSATVP